MFLCSSLKDFIAGYSIHQAPALGLRAEARVIAKAIPRTQKSQTTLEAFS